MPKPIFIAGCPRSGTSILAFLVGAQSSVLAYLEPKGLYEMFNEMVLRQRAPMWAFRSLLALWAPRRLSYAVSEQEAAAVSISSHITIPRTYSALKPVIAASDAAARIARFREFLEEVLGGYAAKCGRSRWCVKAPTYLYPHVDLIYRIHPDMKFIHIVRDGRDTVASIMHQPWARKGARRFRDAVRLWLTLESGDQKATTLPPQSFHRIRLEDLVADEQRIRMLCEFMELEYDDRMKAYYQSRVHQPEARMGRWRTDLTAEQVSYIEKVGGSILARHGYA